MKSCGPATSSCRNRKPEKKWPVQYVLFAPLRVVPALHSVLCQGLPVYFFGSDRIQGCAHGALPCVVRNPLLCAGQHGCDTETFGKPFHVLVPSRSGAVAEAAGSLGPDGYPVLRSGRLVGHTDFSRDGGQTEC